MIKLAKKIKVEDIAREIEKTLHQYVEDVEKDAGEAAEVIAKKAAGALKQNSPQATGEYAKKWTYEVYESGAIVYNKSPTSSLTHLLEKGHAKRNGGRVEGIRHIAPVEETFIQDFEQDVIRRIKG